jgi:phenylacetate-CoA ligase
MFQIHTSHFPQALSPKIIKDRGKLLLSALDQVVALDKLNREEVRAYQFEKLKSLVFEAYHNVPLYWKKYHEAGFDPATLKTIEDLNRIPLITKEDLRNAGLRAIKNFSRREPIWLFSSSGSTGIPSRIYREEQALWHFMARSLVVYKNWCLGSPLINVLYITDLAAGSIDFALADFLQTTVMEKRILRSSSPVPQLIHAIELIQPEFISSYPSTIRSIAIAMHQLGKIFTGLKILHLTSEMLEQTTRSLINIVFPNAKIVETYTSSEAGLIAYSCGIQPSRFHIAETEVLFEIMDKNGNPTTDVGQGVVTDLINHCTPMIRYCGLGDFASLDQTSCECGTTHRSIKALEGRISDSIFTPDGKWISPYILIDAIEEIAGIYQFQIIQSSQKNLEIRIIHDVTNRNNKNDVQLCVHDAMSKAVPSMTTSVNFVNSISSENNRHKIPLVISRGSASHLHSTFSP